MSRLSSGHHQRYFYNFRFSSRKSQHQQKLAKKITYFPGQFRSEKVTVLRTSTHLTLKIICSRNTANSLSDYKNFPANMFLFGARKNISTSSFLDVHELHFWKTLQANVIIFPYISLKKCPTDVINFYLMGVRLGENWINSLRQLTFCASRNVLQYFILTETFENSIIFQYFNSSIYSIKTLNFFIKFWLQV